MKVNKQIGKALGIVVAITVFAILASVLMPVAIGNFNDDTTTTINQTQGQTYNITADLNTTATDINQSADSVTVELQDGANSDTVTVSTTTNETATVGDEDINVTVVEYTGSNSAEMEYQHNNTYGWGTGAETLFDLIPLMLLIAIVLFTVGAAMAGYKG